MPLTQRQKMVTSLKSPFASIAPWLSHVPRRQRRKYATDKLRLWRVVFMIFALLSVNGCSETTNTTTPEGAKQFLKLRGYQFDDQSFLTAAVRGDLMAVNAFLAAGMNPDVKDQTRGETALIAAASRGDMPIAKTLIDGGADVNAKSPTGANALIRALEFKHEEISALLLAKPNLDLNTQRADGTTALMIYAARDKEPEVAQLLERGANVNLQDAEGDTALHRASQSGSLKIVQMLLNKSANPNIQNKVGGT
ncbi:MAG TPA: ankyrin repeat domain-containing protein, partial [Pyrinomonadaceae bacterium]|nr:ankyrin repeat domain-containing protein [Pyrinomonadaceae bacterium]